MEEGLKKRLVGAAVLASLAVIFVPMLVEEPDGQAPPIDKIPAPPPQPAFSSNLLREEVRAPQPLPPEPVVEPLPTTADAEPPEAQPPQAADTPATSPPATRTGLTAWMVQVGSFSKRDNAAQLVEKLRKAGYQTPDADRVEIRGQTLYRVRVGPMVDKDKAQTLLPQINQISGTKGMVSRFQ